MSSYKSIVDLYEKYQSGQQNSTIEENLVDLFKKYDGKLTFLAVNSHRPSWNDGDEISTYVDIYEDLESFGNDYSIDFEGFCDESIQAFLKCGITRVFALDKDHPDFDEYDFVDEFFEVNKIELDSYDRNVLDFYFENFVETNKNYFITYDASTEKVSVHTEDYDCD